MMGKATATKYTDQLMEALRERGYQDGIEGKRSDTRGVEWVSAYMTGYSEGSEERNARIKEKRIKNLRRAK